MSKSKLCGARFAAILLLPLGLSAASSDHLVFTAQLVKTGIYGDAVVYFPVQRVIAVGDLYAASPNPDYSAGGSLVNWGAVLAEILKLDFDVVVPGRGPGISRAELEALKSKLDRLVSRARVLVREGVPKAELLAQLARQDAGLRLTLSADQLDHFYAELFQAPGGSADPNGVGQPTLINGGTDRRTSGQLAGNERSER